MALVLPRRLAPVFPTTYSPSNFDLAKAYVKHKHFESPYHTFVHCKGFAPAAPRRAGTSISVSLSGLPLSRPVRIFGLVGHYPTNNLIRRSLIIWPYVSRILHSRMYSLWSITLRFPRLSSTTWQINYVLLSSLPVLLPDLHGLVGLK